MTKTLFVSNFSGMRIDSLSQIDPLFGTVKQKYSRLPIYPKSHYVVLPERKSAAINGILAELTDWEAQLEKEGRLVESQRIHQRTRFDLEMIKSVGFCHGIENYSRHFSGRLPGEPPPTLLDYFPRDFLVFIDESHVTVPQLHGMWHGDRSRKQNLVDYGFRLPSAMDNRPLRLKNLKLALARRSMYRRRLALSSSRNRQGSLLNRSFALQASSIQK